MNWLGIILLAALLAIPLGYAGAQTPGAAGKPASQPQTAPVKGEAAGTPTSHTPEQQHYLKQTAQELDEFQHKINDLRLKAATGPPQKRRLISWNTKNLQFQAATARNQLNVLEKAPQPAWGEEKAKLQKTMEDLRKSWGAAERTVN